MKKIILFCALLQLFSLYLAASEPNVWTTGAKADVLRGDANGVSIADNGTISIAPKFSRVFSTEQPYVWSSAVDAAGNVYLGTGSDGKIYKVDAGTGAGRVIYDANELNVTALTIGGSGEIFAGTSPDGKVYRIDASGAASVYFEPKEKYIWSLAMFKDGALAVGTGENGRIYKVRASNAVPADALFFDTSETHIISLTTDANGNLYAGTDSNGLVLRFTPDGKPFALLDAPLREIHELAVGRDGSVYALALGDSTATPAATPSPTPDNATVSVEKSNPATPETPVKSRYDLSAAKSAVYRILPDGGSDVIWNSPTVAAFSIAANPNGGGVIIGTADKGRIYSVTDAGQETLLLQSDEGQISTFKVFGTQIYATTSNQGRLFRFGAEPNDEGIYQSPVLDAKAVSNWGRIWWRSAGSVVLQTRSGNTEKPNETWSAWSANYADQKGAQITSPKSKYLQWRAILSGKNSAKGTALTSAPQPYGGVSLSEVNVSFLARNIAPEVLTIQVLPSNVGLAANPPMQVDPNIELSGLDPAVFGIPNAPVAPRRLYQRNANSLQWTAEDRNGDKLLYDIYFRESGETDFKLLKENLTDTFYTLDGQSLADGRYVFKVVAKDSASNPRGQALTGEKATEPFNIDNTAPIVTTAAAPQVSGTSARIVFNAEEASSYINRAEFSVNGGEWQPVYADDGISDGQRERFTVDVPLVGSGEYSITLRVFDANGNSGNTRVVVRK